MPLLDTDANGGRLPTSGRKKMRDDGEQAARARPEAGAHALRAHAQAEERGRVRENFGGGGGDYGGSMRPSGWTGGFFVLALGSLASGVAEGAWIGLTPRSGWSGGAACRAARR